MHLQTNSSNNEAREMKIEAQIEILFCKSFQPAHNVRPIENIAVKERKKRVIIYVENLIICHYLC